MQALVLERKGELSLRDIDLPLHVGPADVKIALHTVGVCGSDVHYYTHGRIGPYVVNAPMVLGHEGAGTVVEVGGKVTGLKVGDRVCMEPGVPDLTSRASKLGLYNVDPAVSFWATPPVHGGLAPCTVHPAAFTFNLPDAVSFTEGAMVEPFAIGMQAAARARIVPGDVGAVIGAVLLGLTAAPAARERVPAMVLLRGLLGRRASALPTGLNVVQCLGWATFEIVIIAEAASRALDAPRWPFVLAAGVLATAMALRPLGVVRVLSRYAVWAALAAAAAIGVADGLGLGVGIVEGLLDEARRLRELGHLEAHHRRLRFLTRYPQPGEQAPPMMRARASFKSNLRRRQLGEKPFELRSPQFAAQDRPLPFIDTIKREDMLGRVDRDALEFHRTALPSG